jgi:hypothetical protein
MDELQKRFGSALGQVLDLLTTRDGSARDAAELTEPATDGVDGHQQ